MQSHRIAAFLLRVAVFWNRTGVAARHFGGPGVHSDVVKHIPVDTALRQGSHCADNAALPRPGRAVQPRTAVTGNQEVASV